jgi:signal transduction histidine kinase
LLEALNNIAKHSGADLVKLSLIKKGGNIDFTVEDNGHGFVFDENYGDDSETTGLGLASMKERAEVFGGSFKIYTGKGKGTTIRMSWPCN